MSAQQCLIPNLNEIMEEYAGSEEDAILELQNRENEKSVPKERTETKPPTKEGRKRKMNEEEENEQDK